MDNLDHFEFNFIRKHIFVRFVLHLLRQLFCGLVIFLSDFQCGWQDLKFNTTCNRNAIWTNFMLKLFCLFFQILIKWLKFNQVNNNTDVEMVSVETQWYSRLLLTTKSSSFGALIVYNRYDHYIAIFLIKLPSSLRPLFVNKIGTRKTSFTWHC